MLDFLGDRRYHLYCCLTALLLTVLAPRPSWAYCTDTGGLGHATFVPGSANINRSPNCSGFYCYPAVFQSTQYQIVTPGCDPNLGNCAAKAIVRVQFPGNNDNMSVFDSLVKLFWETPSGQLVSACGDPGQKISSDDGDATLQVNIACSNLGGNPAALQYRLRVETCNFSSLCPQQVITTVDFATVFCPQPPPPPACSCCEDGQCAGCFGPGGPAGGGGGSGAGGGGPGASPGGSGPGATLSYQAGGVGVAGLPLPAGWTATLGRYWSHDYAEAIVPAPNAAHVYLLNRHASVHEFTDANADDFYETVAPSDDYRELFKTPSGWELHDLDGTVMTFGNDGLWTQTLDRHGNAKVATYVAGKLSEVTFPDGRKETFSYHPGGKLTAITEVGVDGTTTRSWSYTWTGNDLTRIDRPDGTAWVFRYDDPSQPGYLTRQTLIATDLSERVTGAWEYDAEGNVVKTWSGATAFNDPAAVDQWSFSFDDPSLPTQTEVTDPLGNVSTYVLSRDPASLRFRIEQTSGECPTCGLGPNSQLFYDDPQHPLRATREIDGRGTETRYAWDPYGMMSSRIEAFGTALERETTWQYDATYPALMSEMSQPSTTGNPLDERRTLIGYDGAGNAIMRTLEGVEDGGAFSYQTVTTYTAEGRPEVVDPPGYGTGDQTSFTYDPSRGDLVMDSRTEPLIGTTSYGHDVFNRRTSVTDPNGLVTDTMYDALDRVRFAIQRGATPVEDLITEHVYNVFGDLFQTILPEGNVIEYGYDAAGRLTSIERKPDASPSSHGERTVYELDSYGHRIHEEQQRWDGGAWVAESATAYEYATRCQLDKVIAGTGSASESVTEYAYDCDGNLERVWDANHPSAGQSAPASMSYAYDDLDRLTTMTQPWGGAGGGTVVTSYGYDVQDHLVEVIDGEGTVTSYEYSDRDLMTQETSEVSNVTTYEYNEHGELSSQTDARGFTMTRTMDALDRVTFTDYPDNTLDITYTYDDPLVPFSLGRLTRIARAAGQVEYEYDRFGRVTRDGVLTYVYDKNGNRTEVGYPGDVAATYTHDFADREATLHLSGLGGTLSQDVVTASSYLPGGPLSSLTLGNGLSEHRGFDSRYYPENITITLGPSLLDWQYTTDDVGNIFTITDALNATNNRLYGYQDYQYYLTQGDGPWGTRAWSYDAIGNRLSETRDGTLLSYEYLANAAGGNSPRLRTIDYPGTLEDRTFYWDVAGNNQRVRVLAYGDKGPHFLYDKAGRLATIRRIESEIQSVNVYDGRNFLWRSIQQKKDAMGVVHPTTVRSRYSSEGILHWLEKTYSDGTPTEERHLIYFAGRPVLVLEQNGGAPSYQYLCADHLGTPILASDDVGAVLWEGGFEPFGEDWNGAQTAGVFLRFPGQWDDETWAESSLGGGVYYNVHRWYQFGTGRYNRPDPVGIDGGQHLYLYALSNPLRFLDLFALTSYEGFSVSGLEAIKKAVELVKTKLAEEPCCAGGDGSKLLSLLDRAKLVYQENLEYKNNVLCGRVSPNDWIRRRIRIGAAAFEQRCGALECTVLHEVVHLRVSRGGEPAAYKAENDCFGCGTGKPPDND